jgi:hypothetical protein
MRIARHALSLALVATAACADSATAPTAPAALRSADVLASDAVYNSGSGSFSGNHQSVNIQIPTQFAVQDRCAGGRFGEIIVFQGNQHLVFSQTTNSTGHLNVKVQWNADDITGIGQYTGFTYRATGVTQDHTVINGDFPYTETMINNYHVIGQGQATNGDLHETVHYTVNANGDITAWVTDYNFDCKGTPSF